MKFPRLNLPRHGLTKLTVQADYAWMPEYEGWIRDFLLSEQDSVHPMGPEFVALTVTHYRSRGATSTLHALVAIASREEDDPNRLRVDLRYTTDEEDLRIWENARAVLRRESKLAPRVFGLSQADRVYVGSEAKVQPTSADDLWFPLPSRVEDPFGPIEIWGVRGVRFQRGHEEAIDYVFTIERPSGRSAFLSIQWSTEGTVLDQKFLTDALRRSSDIQAVLSKPGLGGNDDIRHS